VLGAERQHVGRADGGADVVLGHAELADIDRLAGAELDAGRQRAGDLADVRLGHAVLVRAADRLAPGEHLASRLELRGHVRERVGRDLPLLELLAVELVARLYFRTELAKRAFVELTDRRDGTFHRLASSSC
jgi:hypothetical protein